MGFCFFSCFFCKHTYNLANKQTNDISSVNRANRFNCELEFSNQEFNVVVADRLVQRNTQNVLVEVHCFENYLNAATQLPLLDVRDLQEQCTPVNICFKVQMNFVSGTGALYLCQLLTKRIGSETGFHGFHHHQVCVHSTQIHTDDVITHVVDG